MGLRRLESSLYEVYWDVTADALNEYEVHRFPPIDNEMYHLDYPNSCSRHRPMIKLLRICTKRNVNY